MTTRRDLFSAAALTFIQRGKDGDNQALALVAEYAACQQRTADVYARRDVAERAMWRRESETCPVVEACDQELTVLWDEMNALVRLSVARPVSDLRHVAAKLMVWRAESLLLGHRLELQRDVFAFSAYRDLLALSGLGEFAHPADGRTLKSALLWDGE